MKITITSHKPRNPLIAIARFRQAGSHRPPVGAQRLQHRLAVRRELDQLTRCKDSP